MSWAEALNGILQVGTSIYNTHKTNQANKALAEYQHQKNLEMWHLGNEYNDPSNQMARLSRAGLNPNLVYGNGTAVTTTGPAPQYQAPRVSFDYKAPDLIGIMNAYQSLKKNQAETDLVRANEEAVKTKTEIDKIIVGSTADDATIKRFQAIYEPIHQRMKVSQGNADLENKAKDAIIKQTVADLNQEELRWNKEGISKNDELVWRMVFKGLQANGISVQDIMKLAGAGVKNSLRDIIPDLLEPEIIKERKEAKNEKP